MSSNPSSANARGHPALAATLRAGFEKGQAKYGELALEYPAFAGDVIALLRHRRASMALPDAPEDLADAASRCALEDLYLARACEHGCEIAWTVFTETFRSRLLGLSLRRGARGAQSESLGAEMFSELALPPARGGSNTRIGTFDGTGSLWGWLAASLVRRFHDAHRRAKPNTPLDDAAPVLASPVAATPSEADAETASKLRLALARGWALLEPNERAALLLKHRHAWSQRQIATYFGVGEHQVSRWCSRAVAKVRGAVESSPDLQEIGGDEPAWATLRQEIERHLARVDVPDRLPADDSTEGSPS